MTQWIPLLLITLSAQSLWSQNESTFKFRDLFNGENLNGWVDVNTSEDTWRIEESILICSGQPIGVMRTDRQYENFVLEIEWRHMESGGNSGLFIWSEGTPYLENEPYTKALEVQILDEEWERINNKSNPTKHGALFGLMTLHVVPDNPEGILSKPLEYRCYGKGKWNKYTIVAVDGVVKLSVNGKFVNGMRNSERKRGYICLESEASEVHFRNIRIMELPNGVISEDQIAPLVD